MFDSLKNLGKLVVNTAALPLDAVADTITLGGALNDRGSYVGKRLGKMGENLEDIGD